MDENHKRNNPIQQVRPTVRKDPRGLHKPRLNPVVRSPGSEEDGGG